MGKVFTINKPLILVIFLSLFILSCRNQNSQTGEMPFSNDLQNSIDQVLKKYSQYKLGISAAVIVPGFSIWKGVNGYSTDKKTISPDMLFIAGSIMKNLQAALILKLVEENKLLLDDSISKYLPAYTNVDQNITIRQLLNHTSGIFNVFEHPEFPWVSPNVDYAKKWPVDEVFDTFVLEAYAAPGYVQHYSSTNYLLLTKIIEKVTGSTVPFLAEKYFLKPLNVKNTFISMGELPPAKFSLAHPWVDINKDGTLEDLYGIPLTWIASLSHPVMFSTAEDLVIWINSLYKEQVVLSDNSLAEMLTYPADAVPDPEGNRYGLGVVDFSDRLGKKVYGHMGSALGYTAAALYMPDYKTSIAWMINTGQSPEDLSAYMMFDIWSAISSLIQKNVEKSD